MSSGRRVLKLRLNKYLSMCGVASRRKADELISGGHVRVNGVIAKELGFSIDSEKDRVEVSGQVVEPEAKRYVILNKPMLFVTAIGEGQDDKKTLDELIADIPERVYPVGRLDYNVEGLVILTNDGELANTILHPRYELPKVYVARVRGRVDRAGCLKMAEGAELEDGHAKPDHIKIVKSETDSSVIEITFHEGRNHLVKRFFSSFGHPVMNLKRTSVGPVKLGALPRGKWRNLKESELNTLRKAVGGTS
jgi:23S rRNA pseudouridine2605 synthase